MNTPELKIYQFTVDVDGKQAVGRIITTSRQRALKLLLASFGATMQLIQLTEQSNENKEYQAIRSILNGLIQQQADQEKVCGAIQIGSVGPSTVPRRNSYTRRRDN